MNDDILWKIDSEIGKDKKVVELRREIEDLTNSNNFWKRKCSEMGIALKSYEKGRYQEHLENEQLHSIIKEAREYIEEEIKDSYYETQTTTKFYKNISLIEEEIESLQQEIKELNDSVIWWTNRFNALQRDYEKLNNIIKEAREYIDKELDIEKICKQEKSLTICKKELLEILDKVEENK